MKKGFTIVELIIVIAVIGVLAAILIPTFANVIDKANAKSALSDARSAVSNYLTDGSTDDAGVTIKDDTVFAVFKAKKIYYFKYVAGMLNSDSVVAATAVSEATVAGATKLAPKTGATLNVPDHIAVFVPAP